MKKKIILTLLIIIIFSLDIFLFYNYIFLKYKNKISLENTDIEFSNNLKNSPFTIENIILYSSASANNKNTTFQDTNWILDIYQYTDIAIYLKATKGIKNLSISNLNLNNKSHKLYYLDANEFGNGKVIPDFEIKDTLDFSVLNFNNSDNSIMYNTPIFFADASNPITLKFTNTLYENYSINNKEKLAFNGSLLTKTPIKTEQLLANFSFNINITDYDNKTYSTTLNIDVPISNENSTIFDGYIYFEKPLNITLF